ncbi:MAG: EamA family transporter [Firmicutes bacterium]|nr:EamA family transporter [Bacillota bacterium]
MLKKMPGTLCTLIAACLFALGGLLMKLIPWHGLAINSFRSAIAFWIILLFLKRTGHRIVVNRSVMTGAACMVLTNLLYSMANKLTTAGNTIILQFTAPIFVIIYSTILFKKKPQKLDLAACACVFAGVVFFFVDGLSAGNMLGNALALMSGMFYGGVFMMNSFDDSDSLSSVLFGLVGGFVTGLPWLLRQDFSQTGAAGWTAALCLAVFQLGVAYIFFTAGLETTPPVAACLITGVEAILNPVLVAVFYHERLTKLSLVGAAIVFISVMAYNLLMTLKKGSA